MNQHHKRIRRMGFMRDQSGIMNRYLREKGSWEPHLEKSREFIRTSFLDRSLESVAVLGSGWLLDVPLDDLRKRFRKVWLVDIFHPPQIVKKVASHENVELIEADLTGGAIEHLWQMHKTRTLQTLEEGPGGLPLKNPLPRLMQDAIISVNLLNQLDILLCEFLEKQGYRSATALNQLRRAIQEFHLDWITQGPGLLITDTTEISIHKSGKESVRTLLYTDLPAGHRTCHWSWDFDTHGSYRPGSLTRMEVQAIEWT